MTDSQNEIRHTVSAGTVVKVLVVVLLFMLLFQIRDILLAIVTSVVVASAIEPFARWLINKAKFPRVLAVITVYLGIFIVLAFLLYAFVPTVADEIIKMSTTLPEQITKLPILSDGFKGSIAGERISNFLVSELKSVDFFSNAGSALSNFGGGVANTAGAVFSGFFTFIMVIVVSFYLAVQDNGIENFLKLVVSEKHEEYAISLWRRTERKIGLWIQGQLLLAVLIGVFVFLGISIFGIGYAMILALWAACMELIPIFGPIIAAVPAVALGFTHSTTIGLAIIAFYIIIQQFENHLIYPLVVRKIVGVPPLVVIIALIVGLELAGFMGVILAVPVAAMLMEIVDDMEKSKKRSN